MSLAYIVSNLTHHCRRCGRYFCDECSSRKMVLPHLSNETVRVCEYCWTEAAMHLRHPPGSVIVRQQNPQALDGAPAKGPGGGRPPAGGQMPPHPHVYPGVGRAAPQNAPVLLLQPPLLVKQPQPNDQPPMGNIPPAFAMHAPAPAPLFEIGRPERDVRPNLPEELLLHVVKMGLGRDAVLRLETEIQERGIPPEDCTFILKQFFESARPPSPPRGRQEMDIHQPRLKNPGPAEPLDGPHAAAEIDTLRRELEKTKQMYKKLEQDQKEIEQQVLGGFSFETWKKVHKLSLDQGKPTECVVCMENEASFQTSCGCKVICALCYYQLPANQNGAKQCPQCFKEVE